MKAITTTSFGMFTETGNRAVLRMVNKIAVLHELKGVRAANAYAVQAFARVAKTHGEIEDTAVREAIYAELDANGQWLELYR
jgi:hypothetical protein